ncbi:cyanate permease [Blastococcus saxobsidens]|uniref:Cyanate permease n=1 Tax=Blastococcus saxobsidens TaxID=138336 RepID=A0A4Q7Y2E4_9ACTN|nr:MFS transporter [Blastococcus saxobsidens]RZU30970.1 cyanate permease [Blastococcus saxobsidens]
MFLVGVLSVQIQADLGFGPAVLGALAASFFAASAVSALSAGAMVRRWGSVLVVRLSALVSAAVMGIVAVAADGAVALIAALLAAGWANGVGQPASNDLIANAVPADRQGLAYGVKQAAIPMATLLAGVGIPLIAIPLGWRWAFGFAALLGLTVAATVPRGSLARADPAAMHSEAAGPFRRAPLVVLSFALMLGAAGGNSLGAFFVPTAVAAGIAPGAAGLLIAGASGAGILVRVLVGWLADRVRARWLLVVAVQLAVGSAAYALLATDSGALIGVAVLVAYCSGWAWAGLATYAVARMHPGMAARATSITQGGMGLGAALGPLSFGATVAATSYTVAWSALAALSLVAAVICVIARRMMLRERPALVAAQRQRRASDQRST